MASPLQQLDRHSLLLMYLADELSGDDKAAAERMLAEDAELRAEVEELRALGEGIGEQFEQLDRQSRLIATESGVQRIIREVRRQEAKARQVALQPARTAARPWPRWVYPFAAAAALLFVFLGLWGAGVIDLAPRVATVLDRRPVMPEDDPILDDELQRSFADSSGNNDPLEKADKHLNALLQGEEEEISLSM